MQQAAACRHFLTSTINMNHKDIRIVFMGTPEFAVESLKALVQNGYNIVGVVTAPDKPVGRHQTELHPSALKVYAQSQGLNILQPVKLKDEEFVEELRKLKADLQVVVAFRMLPEVVWAMPRFGTFNLHAALLPQYRGAAPINWAIINGEKQTGVTTFFLDHDIDTGKIIHQKKVEIKDTDNVENVYDKLMVEGAQLVVQTVNDVAEGKVVPIDQDKLAAGTELKPAPKIFKENSRIDWSLGVKKVYDFIRGMSPVPAAWTELVLNEGKTTVLKIYQAEKEFSAPAESTGSLVCHDGKELKIALSDGYIVLKDIQLAGKKRMKAADFVRGFHYTGNERVN